MVLSKLSSTSNIQAMFDQHILIGYQDGGDEENRTPDPLLARQMLSQLSYTPIVGSML